MRLLPNTPCGVLKGICCYTLGPNTDEETDKLMKSMFGKLGETLKRLGNPVCAAFTATATPEVKADIISQLQLRDPAVFVSGFARPNLSFNVREVSSKAEKYSRICELVDKYKTGIVYCATRKSVETLSEKLWKDGVRHIVYHGAMTPSERDAAQESFIGKTANIAVATNAFGMGIDRPDIRFVCHYELTGSVEALYQEAGRAGRDNSYECFMPIDSVAEEVADYMRFSGGRRTPKRGKFGGNGANSMAVSSSISILRRLGFIERFDVPASRTRGTRFPRPDIDASRIVFPDGQLEEKRRRDEAKLKDVLRYAYSKECRQRWILKYFGEHAPEPCGKCDICRESPAPQIFEALPPDELAEVRKALSGVARMSVRVAPRRWQPRFGREKIVKCLLGSKDEKLLSAGVDRLSTYGILKEHGAKFVSELFTSLVDTGLVEIEDGQYPLAGLTDFGVSVMLGEVAELKMRYPRCVSKIGRAKLEGEKKLAGGKKAAKKAGADGISEADKPLYDELVKVRNKVRTDAGGVFAFKIFTNAVLRGLAAERPKTREEALRVKGIGEVNSRKYLEPFLEAVRNFSD